MEFITIFVLSMMIEAAASGVGKVSDNKAIDREITKFSVWEKCVQSYNTMFFDLLGEVMYSE